MSKLHILFTDETSSNFIPVPTFTWEVKASLAELLLKFKEGYLNFGYYLQ